jgi:hypothetical protein
MRNIKFLLDEHVDPRLQIGMQQRWPDIVVWCIGDEMAPPRSTSDPDILDWCQVHEFLLVTNNRASMPVHLKDHIAAGKSAYGIITLNSKLSFGETIKELATLWATSTLDEHVNIIRYLPIKQW